MFMVTGEIPPEAGELLSPRCWVAIRRGAWSCQPAQGVLGPVEGGASILGRLGDRMAPWGWKLSCRKLMTVALAR